MALVARLLQSLPLVIVLVILALVIYFVVSWARSPERAKEVLIKFFTVFNSILSIWPLRMRSSKAISQYWSLRFRSWWLRCWPLLSPVSAAGAS